LALSDFENQINNLELFKTYRSCLEQVRREQGAYPGSLDVLEPGIAPLGVELLRTAVPL